MNNIPHDSRFYFVFRSLGSLVILGVALCLGSCGRSGNKGYGQASGEKAPVVKDLSWCCENGDMDGVKALLTADKINGGGDQKPPLHLAAGGGHRNVVEFLISQGADINKTDSGSGWTPLYSAVNHGHADVVAMLISQGAKIDISDGRGNYPIHTAAAMGHINVIKVLLKAGAKPDQESGTPYMDRQWMEASSNLRRSASDKYQPIHSAALDNQPEVVKFFISLGISPDAKDGSGHNVLDYAVRKWGWGESRAETIRLVDPDGAFERASRECISTEGYYVTDEPTPKYIRFFPEEIVSYKGISEVFPTRRAVVSFGAKGGTRPGDVSKWLSPANEEAKKQGGFVTGRYKLMGSNVPFETFDSDQSIGFSCEGKQLKISIRSQQQEYFPDSGGSGTGTTCKFVSWK